MLSFNSANGYNKLTLNAAKVVHPHHPHNPLNRVFLLLPISLILVIYRSNLVYSLYEVYVVLVDANTS